MALHITNPKANALARKLAKETGETLTDAVIKALEDQLVRSAAQKASDVEARKAAVMEIVHRIRALPVLDDRTDDEILGYDENGLPT
jgi:antitoxin VapB